MAKRPRIKRRNKVSIGLQIESIQAGLDMAKMDFNKKYLPRIEELMAKGMKWQQAKKYAVAEIDLFTK